MTRPSSRNPHALRASGDRWLFGYADVVTLLFACFATLYASSLTPAVVATAASLPAPPEPAARPAAPSLPIEVEAVSGAALALPGIETSTSVRGFVISLPEAGSFGPGSAELSDQAKTAMFDLSDRLRALPNVIRVEGHTDDVPIATSLFRSNWELSTARATRVVEFLINEGGINPGRLAAAGYGEHRPRVANADAAARARNRRVDIVVLDPVSAEREEPGAATR